MKSPVFEESLHIYGSPVNFDAVKIYGGLSWSSIWSSLKPFLQPVISKALDKMAEGSQKLIEKGRDYAISKIEKSQRLPQFAKQALTTASKSLTGITQSAIPRGREFIRTTTGYGYKSIRPASGGSIKTTKLDRELMKLL